MAALISSSRATTGSPCTPSPARRTTRSTTAVTSWTTSPRTMPYLPSLNRHRRMPGSRSDQVLVEKLQGQVERAVGLGLAVGLAAETGEGVVGARILVDRDQRVGRKPALQKIVHLGLDPAVAQRHVQHERPMQIGCLANVMLDIGAVIGDRAVDVGAAAHQVAELAAEAIADRAHPAVALLQSFEIRARVFHVADREVVVEIVVEIERLAHVVGIVIRELDARLLAPEQVGHQADEAGFCEFMGVVAHRDATETTTPVPALSMPLHP